MDGTLLNHAMEVPEKNIAAVKQAQAAGIEFITATGRGIAHAKSALDHADIHVPMILLNGARIIDEAGKTVFAAPIEREKAFQILDLLDAQQIYYEIFTDEHVYSQNQAFRIDFFADRAQEIMPQLTKKQAIATTSKEMLKLPLTYVENIQQQVLAADEEVLKIIAFDKIGPEHLAPIRAKLHALGGLAVTSSEETNLEINHQDAQKGIALAHYAELKGLTADEIMAIGDNLNDISMLSYAKTSFAMGNAAPEVKQIATNHTATNEENGVAQAIEYVLAQNGPSFNP